MPIIRIHNIETNEIIDREMNEEEYRQFLERQERSRILDEELEQRKVARNALLEKLGITEDEAKLLLS